MWAAGYNFFLLNNVFTSHWGFQRSSSRPPWRIKQTESNSFKFAKFCEEVMAWDFFVFKLYKDFILQISVRYGISREIIDRVLEYLRLQGQTRLSNPLTMDFGRVR